MKFREGRGGFTKTKAEYLVDLYVKRAEKFFSTHDHKKVIFEDLITPSKTQKEVESLYNYIGCNVDMSRVLEVCKDIEKGEE